MQPIRVLRNARRGDVDLPVLDRNQPGALCDTGLTWFLGACFWLRRGDFELDHSHRPPSCADSWSCSLYCLEKNSSRQILPSYTSCENISSITAVNPLNRRCWTMFSSPHRCSSRDLSLLRSPIGFIDKRRSYKSRCVVPRSLCPMHQVLLVADLQPPSLRRSDKINVYFSRLMFYVCNGTKHG